MILYMILIMYDILQVRNISSEYDTNKLSHRILLFN